MCYIKDEFESKLIMSMKHFIYIYYYIKDECESKSIMLVMHLINISKQRDEFTYNILQFHRSF